jgi:cytochrome c556
MGLDHVPLTRYKNVNKGGNMKSVTKTIAVLAIFGILVGAAWAQFAKPEDAVKYRQSVMFVMAKHFGRLGAMVKGQQPYDQKVFADNTAVIEFLAKLPWEAFLMPGTDKGQTTMKSSVLKDPDGFRSLSGKFESEVAKLSAAAKGNNFDEIKSRFGAVAQSCKGCHSKARK